MGVPIRAAFSPELLASVRRDRGLSQPQLADAAHLKVGTLRALEQGRVADPGVATVARLAEALSVSMDDLLAVPA